jgi:Bacterial membrane protein YfhO
VPFWTPYIFTGFPFLADLQVGTWYPLNWPFFAAGITPRSIGGELLVSSLVATSGAYVLSRRFVRDETAAIATGMFYGLSGWFAAHSQHVGMVGSAAWLPWLLVCLVRFAEIASRQRLAALGLVGAAIALPGSFQIALYTFSFVAIWVLCEAVAQASWRTARRLSLGLAVVAIWGALLAAVMILPALELVGGSVRTQLSALELPDIGFFHASSLLTLILPNYYGLLSGRYTGPGDSTQHYFYAGLLLVPLAILGARQRTLLRTAAALGLPFLWYALGPRGGGYLIVARLPGFASVELPMHGWFLPALGLALLGGAGADVVARRFGQRWAILLITLIFVDVLIVNQVLNPLAYARESFETLYGSALQAFDARVQAADPPVERVYGPPRAAVAYRNHALQSRVPTTYGYNPLELAAYAAYTQAAAGTNPRLVSGLAANYQLSGVQLTRLDRAVPLAYFAHDILVVADQAAAVQALNYLDPATTTLVLGAPPRVEANPSASVNVVVREPEALTLHYASATPNLLRVAIPIYPGWQATLGDGQELSLVTLDAAFIGVLVPAGQGDIRLAYTPRWFWPGALLSGLALLAASTALAWPRAWRPRPRAAAPHPSPPRP